MTLTPVDKLKPRQKIYDNLFFFIKNEAVKLQNKQTLWAEKFRSRFRAWSPNNQKILA